MSIRKIMILVSIMVFSIQLAGAASVSIGSNSTTSGGIVTLPIAIGGASNLASATVTLSYTPGVVTVQSVSGGNAGALMVNINNVTGVTTISVISPAGASGNLTLADITLKAVGTAGSSSNLSLAVSSFKDINSNDIPFTTTNGIFTVIAGVTPLSAMAGGPYSGIAGAAVQFSGLANGGTSPYTYSWNFGDGSTGSGQNPSHTYVNTGSYTAVLTVTDATGATATNSASVSIISAGVAMVSISSVQTFPSSTAIAQINVSNVQNLGSVNVKLSYNPSVVTVQGVSGGSMGTPTTSINNATGVTTMVIFSTTGVSGNVVFANINLKAIGLANANSLLGITVITLTDTNGIPISYTISNGSFTIIPGTAPPTADAGGPYSGNAGSVISFTGSASGGTPPYTSYSWNFGDGSTSNQQNPTHTYSSGGTYNAQLTVQDSTGATASDSATVNIVGGGVLISIDSVNLTVNNTGNVSIKVKNVLDLAAVKVTLSYNSSVINVDKVGPGIFGSPISNINNAAGTTTIAIFSTTGQSGNITIANLTLRGISTGSTPLTLNVPTVIDFADSNGVPISNSLKSGTANVLSVIKGDVNGDGQVTIVDALFIAQYTVQTRTLTPAQLAAADVNGDGQVTIVDALFIAQFTVGTRQI